MPFSSVSFERRIRALSLSPFNQGYQSGYLFRVIVIAGLVPGQVIGTHFPNLFRALFFLSSLVGCAVLAAIRKSLLDFGF